MQGPQPQLSYADFLVYSESQAGRFEYADGRVLAMGIPSDVHGDLAAMLLLMLDPHVRLTDCKVRLAGRLRMEKHEHSPERSPDLLVICDGKPSRLIGEFLSPNRGDDLTEKLAEYQAMREFEEYLVVDLVRRWVRFYRRSADGLFVYDTDHIAGSVERASIGYALDIDTLYAEVEFAPG